MKKPVNRVLFDYLTISFKELSSDEVLNLVCDVFSNEIFKPENFVKNNHSVMTGYGSSYKLCDTPYISINWHKDFPDFGVSLNITGKGCNFLSEGDIKNFFNVLYGSSVKHKVTRCDVALDDFSGLIPYDTIIEYVQSFLLKNTAISTYTKNSSVSLYQNSFDNEGSFNCSVGAKGSERSFRLYDKRIEQKLKISECEYWKRWEIQARGNYATKIIEYYVKNDAKLSHLFSDFMFQTFRFLRSKDKEYAIKGQATTARWYIELLEHIKRIDYKGQIVFNDIISCAKDIFSE